MSASVLSAADQFTLVNIATSIARALHGSTYHVIVTDQYPLPPSEPWVACVTRKWAAPCDADSVISAAIGATAAIALSRLIEELAGELATFVELMTPPQSLGMAAKSRAEG